MTHHRRLRIVLISPKSPMYRHRGGIFGWGLRYKPLTLTTLAALIPRDLKAEVELFDEGIQDIDLDLRADLVGITLITGNAERAYELADHFRSRSIPVVLGGSVRPESRTPDTARGLLSAPTHMPAPGRRKIAPRFVMIRGYITARQIHEQEAQE